LRALPWHVVHRQCYIPADILARHSLTPADLFARSRTPALDAALADVRRLARDHLAKAQQAIAALPRREQQAYRALALPELFLRQMERPDYDPFKTLVEVAQWRRQWALWRGK